VPLKILGVSHSGSTVSDTTPSSTGLSSGDGWGTLTGILPPIAAETAFQS